MDLERVKAIIDYYDWMLQRQGFLAEKFPDDEMIDDASDYGNCGAKRHVRAMIAEMQTMIVEGRTEKCMIDVAIQTWLKQHGFPEVRVTALKPKAHVYLDDRGWRFEGTFPSVEELAAFKPWNRR